MNNKILYKNILANGGELQPVSTVGFFFYRELTTILPRLIKSNLKQKLLIELSKTTESACNELTVLSCDQYNYLNVVSGHGMPLIVNKSI